MKFRKIVGFGDSWMHGDELLDPVLAAAEPEAHTCWEQNTDYREQHCFLGLLGEHYAVPTENFGIPGGSLRSSIWTYLWWLEHERHPQDCLVLVCLTEADRETFYNPNHVHYSNDPAWNKFIHSTWVNYGSSVVPLEWQQMVKQYLVLSNSPGLRKYNYLECIHFFEGQRHAIGMPLIQFHTMPPPVTDSVDSIIMPDRCWTLFFRDHPNNQNRELIKPGGHPNEKGHEIIRDVLIPEIDRVTLAV
jgi:hypothetical protein